MRALVKRFTPGKRFKSNELTGRNLSLENIHKNTYKVWTTVEEIGKDDILTRLAPTKHLAGLDFSVQKPAYVRVTSDYIDILSLDTAAFSNVTEIIRKIFGLEEVKTPPLTNFDESTVVEYVHLFDHKYHTERSILFDQPIAKKDLVSRLNGSRPTSFLIRSDDKQNGLYVSGMEIFEAEVDVYFSDAEGEEVLINKTNESTVVHGLSKIVDRIYKYFEKI
jgi:hypothetical protein